MEKKYYSMKELFSLIKKPNGNLCLKLITENQELLSIAWGKNKNHNWYGGYFDYLTDVMNIAKELYTTFDNLRPLPFSLSDTLLVLYLQEETLKKFISNEYGVELKLLKDEKDNILSNERIKNSLELFIDICDSWSSNVWSSYPLERNDPWLGAKRNKLWVI